MDNLHPYKKSKTELQTKPLDSKNDEEIHNVIIQFQKSDSGEKTGGEFHVPISSTILQLEELLNGIIKNEEPTPYSFYLYGNEIIKSLEETFKVVSYSSENVLPIEYVPQAMFNVRPVTRCTATLPGHDDAVLTVCISPCGSYIASGSGDKTIRLWDPNTQTPFSTLKSHTGWILALEWAPDMSLHLASGSMDNDVRIWNVNSLKNDGNVKSRSLKGHKKWVTSLSWEPFHLSKQLSKDSKLVECTRLASASKDGTVRVWDTLHRKCLVTLSGHSLAVTSVVWSGSGLICSASEDRTIRIATPDGRCLRILQGHSHWVNNLALSTAYILRLGAYDPNPLKQKKLDQYFKDKNNSSNILSEAIKRYNHARSVHNEELLLSSSDDKTICLWSLSSSNPIIRLTGHQQPICTCSFSPDGRLAASAGFDRSVRVYDVSTAISSNESKQTRTLATFRGHVQRVYHVSWSPDSRMLLSGSQDSTLKIWNIRTKKMNSELPGHSDEIYAMDWSPDGETVVSGGKDKNVKIWKR